MKNLTLAILLGTATIAQAVNEKKVKSTIKNVTVFTQGAQVFRSTPVSLTAGNTDLVFSAISPTVNPSSIQACGKGSFIILEVKHQIRYPEPEVKTESGLVKEIIRKIKLYEDSLFEIGFNEEDLNEKRNALMLEKNMIQKNKLAIGEGKSDSLNVLKQAMEFFRAKLSDINDKLIRIKRDEQRLKEDKTRMNASLADLRKYFAENETPKKYDPVNEIIVTVSADEPATGLVEVSYMVSSAGWIPSYDLRSITASGPVELTYKANIYQNTGEEWENVTLKLSTSNPNRSSTKPELPVWYLNYYYPRYKNEPAAGATRPMLLDEDKDQSNELQKKMDELSPSQTAANYSQIVETMTNVEFDVKLAYSIPSDGIHHVVPVKNSALPAAYQHYLVPKIESEAFLIAKVTGWEELNLLPGKVNIFYEGTYVGQTVINPQVIKDTLDLSLGRDHGITITRKRLPVTEKNKLLGSEIVKTIAYELKIKNNKSGNISLVVEDQIPVSQNKEIKVELKDKGQADYNDKTGLLKWTASLSSKENKTLVFSYAVTFNKDMPLSMY